MSDRIVVDAGPLTFAGRLEEAAAPRTCVAFRSLLPLAAKLVQARWSGQSAWVPLGNELELGLPPENATTLPLPGQLLLYPGGVSEVEILVPYGPTHFLSVAGPLAGNHFLTLVEGVDQLAELGRLVLWEGAQDVRFELAAA